MSALSAIHGLTATILSNFFVTLPYPETRPGLPEKTIIVTGANTGLGLEASRHLLRIGVGKLIMGVRNRAKGEEARSELLKSTKRSPGSVEVWDIDMASYDSVRAFARRATSDLPRVDAVLANAGIMVTKFAVAEDNERTITVNISPFPGKFVIPNSALHCMAPINELSPDGTTSIFSRLNDPEASNMMARYSVSKLLPIYVTREIASRMKASGKPAVIINTPSPSYCKSGLGRNMDGPGPPRPPEFMARSTKMGQT